MFTPPIPANLRSDVTEKWLQSKSGISVTFSLARPDDAEFILDLRTDPALNTHISATEKNLEKQRKWLEDYCKREAAGMEFYFIINYSSSKVGTVRIYDIKDFSFSWGSWVIRPGTGSRVALGSTALIYDLGFNIFRFQTAEFDVRRDNHSVNKYHRRLGANLISEDESNYYYKISAPDLNWNFLRFSDK